jgi:hypothetical protein
VEVILNVDLPAFNVNDDDDCHYEKDENRIGYKKRLAEGPRKWENKKNKKNNKKKKEARPLFQASHTKHA